MLHHTQIYIDGQWVDPISAAETDVINPATEQVCARIPSCGAEDADRAVTAARAAFDSWSQTPLEDRLAYLMKIHQGLNARQGDLNETISTEIGTPISMAPMTQTGTAMAQFGLTAKQAAGFEWEEKVGSSKVVREAYGVVVAIAPWNYPLHQLIVKVAPALAAGCTLVVKASEVSPLNAFVLAEIIHEAGLPAGVFNMVSGSGRGVGGPLVEHPEVDLISFTGSTSAGRHIAATAAQMIKKVSLELGGKSAAIVLPDADPKTVVKGMTASFLVNTGQTCVAHTRMLVHEDQYESYRDALVAAVPRWQVGDPKDEAVRVGPLVSEDHWNSVQSYIQKGIDEGSELVLGGLGRPDGLETGYYMKPTIFGRVDPKSTIGQEELFGPVLAIITYKTEEEAIAIANDSIYGLSGAVYSADTDKAEHVARKMRTGMVDINGTKFNLMAPFGGYKQSGIGREFGVYGIEEFTELKAIQL